ncbi:MAG: hypothetical protein JXR96_04210 [Deltaproteobacteria bacterium]|nr:hypothetical protein [Deltaproteobacteria bacterium]
MCACIAILAGLWPAAARAYLDPATGSYIFQLLVAGLLGGLLTLKLFWRNVKGFFARLFSKHRDAGPED